ncbi:MAG: HEPN domain-containing protein [Candidatus Diapherotrites archaeon]
MKLDSLIGNGLLLKTKASEEEINGSLGIAERFLEKAKGNMKIGYFDVAFSLAYQSMFHAARALLFKNNLKERSHSAMVSALKEIYAKEEGLLKLLHTLDSYRITRHAIQYTGSGCSKEDAGEAINDAEKFINLSDKILFDKKTKNGKKKSKG